MVIEEEMEESKEEGKTTSDDTADFNEFKHYYSKPDTFKKLEMKESKLNNMHKSKGKLVESNMINSVNITDPSKKRKWYQRVFGMCAGGSN